MACGKLMDAQKFYKLLEKISLDFLKTAIEYGVALFNFLKISNRSSKKPKRKIEEAEG
jgi:hypothetical protein